MKRSCLLAGVQCAAPDDTGLRSAHSIQPMIRTFLRHRIAVFGLATLALPSVGHAQAFAQREEVRTFIADLHNRHGFDARELENVFSQAESLPRVIDLIRPPSQPGVRSWKRYRSRFIEPTRISAGIRFWQAHEQVLRAAEDKYGVPAEIIAAIIGVETIYGRNTGNFSTLSALTTLAFDYPPRAALFRGELEALLLLAREQGRNVLDYRGSYAGALGLPQFLPSSVRMFARDGDGDGFIDLLYSPQDAIASVANFLADHGWQRGGRIVEAARVIHTDSARALVAMGIQPLLTAEQLKEADIWSAAPPIQDELVTLVDLETPDEATQYWLGFHNFYVITRYNRSSFYAMAVHDLAQALKEVHTAQTRQAPAINAMQSVTDAAASSTGRTVAP